MRPTERAEAWLKLFLGASSSSRNYCRPFVPAWRCRYCCCHHSRFRGVIFRLHAQVTGEQVREAYRRQPESHGPLILHRGWRESCRDRPLNRFRGRILRDLLGMHYAASRSLVRINWRFVLRRKTLVSILRTSGPIDNICSLFYTRLVSHARQLDTCLPVLSRPCVHKDDPMHQRQAPPLLACTYYKASLELN